MQERPMQYALMLEPQQGMSYADQLAAARRAEAVGFDAFFRSDHYINFGNG
jgi:alkanesulfonate monooxygenase SsuD/methylene tetrahydromethanopterin reductase-like flavin-dependent oxidoreductase (luciferase family)